MHDLWQLLTAQTQVFGYSIQNWMLGGVGIVILWAVILMRDL
jgi:hypothetical protein